MMYVNEASADRTVASLEIKPADSTERPVVLDTSSSRTRIAFVTVDQHATDGSLVGGLAYGNLTQGHPSHALSWEAGGGNLSQTLSDRFNFLWFEEVGIALIEHGCLDGQIHLPCFQQVTETGARLFASEKRLRDSEPAVVAHGAEELVGPVPGLGPDTAIQALHLFVRICCCSQAPLLALASLPDGGTMTGMSGVAAGPGRDAEGVDVD